MVHVIRYSDAEAFLRRAEPWLLQNEAEHNLILGVARSLTHSMDGYEQPIYLVTLEEEGDVVGCAFRTPPYKLGLTRMPLEAIPALVRDVGQVYPRLPAVLGSEQEVQRFAALWSEETGIATRRGMEQRIYQATEIIMPEPMPFGRLRPAREDDTELVSQWIGSFGRDARIHTADPGRVARKMIDQQALALWENERPVCMAGWSGRTSNGVRIGYVYTPDEHRRCGYASAAVATLSHQLLETGLTFCFLYTDLSNPTSNAIYSRIGYRPVCDVIDYVFESASG